MRRSATPRTTFATSPAPRAAGSAARGGAARERAGRAGWIARCVRVVLAAPLLAVIGAAYVVLLPICGIASVLEGILGATWSWMRATAHPGATMRHHHR